MSSSGCAALTCVTTLSLCKEEGLPGLCLQKFCALESLPDAALLSPAPRWLGGEDGLPPRPGWIGVGSCREGVGAAQAEKRLANRSLHG